MYNRGMTSEINPQITQLAEAIAQILPPIGVDTSVLKEELDLAQRQIQRLQMEDQGWILLQGGTPQEEGPSLDQVKSMSGLLRAGVAESPIPKQANTLRASYTFGKPFLVSGLEIVTELNPEGTTRRGRKTDDERAIKALKDFAASRSFREYVMGDPASDLISTACSTDGVYLLLGDNAAKTVNTFPLKEVADVLVNPDHPGEVWAYLREWTTYDSGKPKPMKRWYYTDRFTGTKVSSYGEGPSRVTVDRGKTIIDLSVNRQTGWPLGMPDLWAPHVWARNYMMSVKDGMEVTSLMAHFSAKIKQQTPGGAAKTGVEIAKGGPAASVQTYAAGNSIDTYATTGKAYDFDALRPIAALYALGAGVSVVDLLASPSAAGASYGSAQALAPSMRRAIEIRRNTIAAWIERVLEWGTGSYHRVTPVSIEELEPYRRMQMVVMALNSGLYYPDEIRPLMAYLAGITVKHEKEPEGWLPPNNEDSLPRKDIDTDGSSQSSTAPQAGTPGQGQSDGTGGQGSTASSAANRTDTQT